MLFSRSCLALLAVAFLPVSREEAVNDRTATLGAVLLAANSRAISDRSFPELEDLMKTWEKEVREKCARDAQLKALLAKYSFGLVHSRSLYDRDRHPFYSSYSFRFETSDSLKWKSSDLEFHNAEPMTIRATSGREGQHLVVDLGKVDFENDPDPRKVSLNGSSAWATQCKAVEGHVYILRKCERRFDDRYFVLFRVVALDPKSRYMAFVWRKLPGAIEGDGKFPEPDDPEYFTYSLFEKNLKTRINRNREFAALARKHPLMVLWSTREHQELDLEKWRINLGFSFVHGTCDPKVHQGDVQLRFDTDRYQHTLDIYHTTGQENLAADLGEVDFDKDPDPASVPIDGERTWVSRDFLVQQSHVYLLRIRDDKGNRFFALIKVAEVCPRSSYVAFIWRILPGGKVVKE